MGVAVGLVAFFCEYNLLKSLFYGSELILHIGAAVHFTVSAATRSSIDIDSNGHTFSSVTLQLESFSP